jgi:hypothetical protein
MKQKFMLIIAVMLLLSGCQQAKAIVNELVVQTVTYEETIHINNCGGKAESEQTSTRSFSTNYDFEIGLSVGKKDLLQGSVAWKYGQYSNVTKSQRVIAPPDTNMEYLLKWSEEEHAGTVTIDGETGKYKVHIPIGVEQISSVDHTCLTKKTEEPGVVNTKNSQDPEIAFLESFDGPDGNLDPNIWACSGGDCNALNNRLFRQNGMFIFKYDGSDDSSRTWATVIKSNASWETKALISIEEKLKIGSNSRGGIWLGVDGDGWQGAVKGTDCSITAVKPNVDTPQINCSIGPDEKKDYTSSKLSAAFDQWYTVKISFDPTTREQKFFVDGQQIGQFTPQNLSENVSVILGVFCEDGQPADVYVDDIVVKTLP